MSNNYIFPSLSSNYMKSKKKLLVWSDSVLATTGFGRVSHYILKALYATGQYEIDQLAINHMGEFYDIKEVPYSITPARLGNPSDPYGNQMFIDAIQKKEYDIVFIINDTFVVEGVGQKIEEIKTIKRSKGHKIFNLVYYYPVDCRLLPQMSKMIRVADRAVAYTDFARRMSEEVGVFPTDVIYHGVDTKSFYPISAEERRACRRQFLGVDSDDRFVIVNVNRNSLRKDLAKTILVFHEFRKIVPSCVLYLHTKVMDEAGGHPIDLRVPLDELGLDPTKDVIFPNKYSAAKGFPIRVLNQLYNCGDAFISTHLGEGFGLTLVEAMACGVPVIAPNNTTTPEIFGKDRGYIYECKEKTYIDNSGYRPTGRIEDILEQMKLCYEDWRENNQRRQKIIKEARKFTRKYSWDKVCVEWVKLFGELKEKRSTFSSVDIEGEAL